MAGTKGERAEKIKRECKTRMKRGEREREREREPQRRVVERTSLGEEGKVAG